MCKGIESTKTTMLFHTIKQHCIFGSNKFVSLEIVGLMTLNTNIE